MKSLSQLIGIFIISSCVFLLSCGKNFLEVKHHHNLVIPASVKDYQAMLDNSNFLMNTSSSHLLGFLGSDEFYVSDQRWNSVSNVIEQNAYLWSDGLFGMESVSDWNYAYKRIFHANLVLEGINGLSSMDDPEAFDNVKGSALFFRAFNFYQIAEVFCVHYRPATADDDPGIPLRLEPDITIRSKRASVAATYTRIVDDLEAAAVLLPQRPLIKERPSKPAAYALLARVYLQMGLFEEALYYADECLKLSGELVDFNSLNLDTDDPANIFDGMRQTHPEVLFHSTTISSSLASYSQLTMDTVLLDSYVEGDLRRKAYFVKYAPTGADLFRASYSVLNSWFTGLAVDEVMLVKAECLARLNSVQRSLDVLNRLLANRYDHTFEPLASSHSGEALSWILAERRKELVLRGVRWSDLRRLNMDDRFKTTLVRVINGDRFELPPDDRRWVLPLPYDVVLQSGME